MEPPATSPVRETKLMMPAGEFDASVDADPPRMASRRPTVASARRKMSDVAKAMSPKSITGRPSSWSWR